LIGLGGIGGILILILRGSWNGAGECRRVGRRQDFVRLEGERCSFFTWQTAQLDCFFATSNNKKTDVIEKNTKVFPKLWKLK
jgi:hypothetical protein